MKTNGVLAVASASPRLNVHCYTCFVGGGMVVGSGASN